MDFYEQEKMVADDRHHNLTLPADGEKEQSSLGGRNVEKYETGMD